jgi:outer membrane cobalamin receptor
MRRICCLVLATLAVLSPAPARAQVDRGVLHLRVMDATGLPLRSAGTITSEAPQFFRAFETDSVGTFVLENLPFGRYRLRLESDGFAPYSTIVEIRTAVPRTLRIELSVALTSAVEVTNEPPLVDVSRAGVVFSIGAPQSEATMPSVPGRRLLDLVDAQPGWLMEANGVLHPRGSEYQTLFVVDGIPMDDNRSPAFAPDLQDSDLQAVHVLTGNFPAEYGRKLGGVVEVTTARDIRHGLHGTADLGGGSFGTASGGFSGSYGWNRRSISGSVTAAQTDRYLDPPTTENYTNHGTLSGVTLNYDDRPSDADRLHFTWHQRQTDFLVPNERIQQLAGQRQERQGAEIFGQGGWSRIIGSQFIFDVHGVAEQVKASLDSNPLSTPVIVSQDRRLTRGYTNASLAGDFGRHHVKFGGDLVFAPIREQLDYTITDPSVFEDGTPGSLTFSDHRNDHEQSLFAQDTLAVGSLTASIGLRWDHYALVVKDHALSPRLGAAWSLANGDIVLRASYDRVFQTPAVENLLLASSRIFENVSQKAVTLPVLPSRGNFIEGGVTAALWHAARLDITGYRRTFSQFADDDVLLNTGVSFPIAFDSARVNGMDVKVTMPARKGISGYMSYSLMKGSATLPAVGGLFVGEEALAQLDGSDEIAITQDQRHTVRGRLRYDVNPRVWTAVTFHYGSGLPVEIEDGVDENALRSQYGDEILARVNLESGRVRPNFSMDLGSGMTIWRRGSQRQLQFRVEVANLTNRLNVIDFAGIFSGTAIAAPRSATVGLQLEF